MVFPTQLPAGPPIVGPLLEELITAQRAAEEVVGYPTLRSFAEQLVRHCRELDGPVVWPADDAAQRVAGAAVLVSEGRVRVRGWGDVVPGERVLLVAVAAVTPVLLMDVARHARALGAAEIHAFDVSDVDALRVDVEAAFDSYEVAAFPPRESLVELRGSS
jgi:hypothetical protein